MHPFNGDDKHWECHAEHAKDDVKDQAETHLSPSEEQLIHGAPPCLEGTPRKLAALIRSGALGYTCARHWRATNCSNGSDNRKGEDRARDSGNQTANGTRNEDSCTREVENAVQQARRKQRHAEQPDHYDQRDTQQRRWTCAEQHQEERRKECGTLAD
jgi:hypothetical protein